jgi:hypothetical protein
MGNIMITVGIAVVAGFCYWLECYPPAFWILIYAIVYGVLVALRAIIKANDISRGLWRPEQNSCSEDR